MEQQYITTLLEAYRRGYEVRYKDGADAPERKEHYFKVKEDLPRAQVVLGFLRGIVPAGQCQSLLDVGSGRGVFLFPLLRDFPDMEVTSLDILPHRVELLQCLREGGISNLHPLQEDICTWNAPDKSFDVVTMLEVMEHIPDTEAVVCNAIRLARNYVIVSAEAVGCRPQGQAAAGAGLPIHHVRRMDVCQAQHLLRPAAPLLHGV